MSYKQELDKMIWSFSRIHTWEQCPYAFYLQYIEKNQYGISNFWAENGKAVHTTLEKFFKGEIFIDDCPATYIDLFEKISEKTSISTMDKAFNACVDFFCEFDFNIFDDYQVLGIEKECNFVVNKYRFRGFIDLLLKNKKTEEIIVLDHKSSSYPFKKDGKSVLKNCQANFEAYKHQMYLYCKQVIDEYGEKPSYITWLHFKDRKMATIPFNDSEYDKTLQWAENTIDKIYKDDCFLPKESFMMCDKLCNYRCGECSYKEMKEIEG